MWNFLKNKQASYTEAESRISVAQVTILTHTKQYAHHLKTASEVAFVDSTTPCDSNIHSITFLLVKSPHRAGVHTLQHFLQ